MVYIFALDLESIKNDQWLKKVHTGMTSEQVEEERFNKQEECVLVHYISNTYLMKNLLAFLFSVNICKRVVLCLS